VFVERFFGSSLPPGTISHLNYAQKVAQVPMVLALAITSVTFPALARAIAGGERGTALNRLWTDLRVISMLVLLASAYLVALAPAVIGTLFQHGRFTPADTAATAAIVRVYVLGLLGHALVGVLSRPFFSADRPTWYPAGAMAAGLLLTAALAAVVVPVWGAPGIAGANAAGISVTAVILLAGLRSRMSIAAPAGTGVLIGRLAVPAVGAAAVGWVVGRLLGGLPPLAVAVLGGLVVTLAFAAMALPASRNIRLRRPAREEGVRDARR
jgi:putative peptidoglycan lipid II flippase